jgi:hypothetical protein
LALFSSIKPKPILFEPSNDYSRKETIVNEGEKGLFVRIRVGVVG